MNYSQNQLFEVAKKLLIFSGKKQILSATEKKKIMPQLSLILEDIQKDKTQLSLKVSEFIKDILSDIENDRVIDIDSIQADNHLENFIQAESYTVSYNSILKQ
jgi:hypothetical protein